MNEKIGNKGLIIAISVIIVWLISMTQILKFCTNLYNPLNLLAVLWLTFLYTGLFITAHDAIHGTVSKNNKVNNWIGRICLSLYAAFNYNKIKLNHQKHHQSVATEDDPDFHPGNFLNWYFKFLLHYVSVIQLIILAITFNVLHYLSGIPKANLIVFWIVPPLLSTFQLFYFGTFRPHNHPEKINNDFKTRSQKKNHIWSFICCYFFGYHLEHHKKPFLPWWLLWTEK